MGFHAPSGDRRARGPVKLASRAARSHKVIYRTIELPAFIFFLSAEGVNVDVMRRYAADNATLRIAKGEGFGGVTHGFRKGEGRDLSSKPHPKF